MGAKWNSVMVIVFIVAMVMAMEKVNGNITPKGNDKEECIHECTSSCSMAEIPRQFFECYTSCIGHCPALTKPQQNPNRRNSNMT
ncbi:hypothetical protein AALP_AA1G316400 [Arabis alpina]|uniref:Plant thionin family protein n=1 Tax=Arabis alpina TaxID=50452 RepID=A0A087HRZ0_ARAAL|nr:hypothetical protein AALP_AA1G316400 [Arabis alpina]